MSSCRALVLVSYDDDELHCVRYVIGDSPGPEMQGSGISYVHTMEYLHESWPIACMRHGRREERTQELEEWGPGRTRSASVMERLCLYGGRWLQQPESCYWQSRPPRMLRCDVFPPLDNWDMDTLEREIQSPFCHLFVE